MHRDATDVFISYAQQDRDRVAPLAATLEGRGWRVFWDRAIPPGATWEEVIDSKLEHARCLIVLWSVHSVGSKWVKAEATEGSNRGILVPAMIDPVKVPLPFRSIQAANLVGWSGEDTTDLAQLISVVAEKLGTASANVESTTKGALSGPTNSMSQPPKSNPTRTPLWKRFTVAGLAISLAFGGLIWYWKRGHMEPQVCRGEVGSLDELCYVQIPAGTFMMGCSPGDSDCDPAEQKPHFVTITRPFRIGATPVTQKAYKRVVGTNPSDFEGDMRPVEGVSAEDAQTYCKKVGMRLPTEAEWEYAARAGMIGPLYGNLDDIAWYSHNSSDRTHEVMLKQANAWGLYDMLGNVWQWTADSYTENGYSEEPVTDPKGPEGRPFRALRGGSFNATARVVRVSMRGFDVPGRKDVNYYGFRCAEN